MRCPNCGWEEPVLAQPKRPRVEDDGTLVLYALEHPACEVRGCVEPPLPTPHHIRPVSLGGNDAPENLIRLCFNHHVGRQGVHPIGHRRWWAKFDSRLSPEAREKGKRAWPLKGA